MNLSINYALKSNKKNDYNEYFNKINDFLHEAKGIDVLDIGCGTGNLYNKIKEHVNYVGMDQSLEMLLQAKNKFHHIKLRQ